MLEPFSNEMLGLNEFPAENQAVLVIPAHGLYGNPKSSAEITTQAAYNADNPGHIEAYARTKLAGANVHYEIIQWSLMEATVGTYDFSFFGRLVENTPPGLPLMLNIAVIDSDSAKHVPSSLAAVAWDDPSMSAAFINMVNKLSSVLDNRQFMVTIGNEVNYYFSANPTQIAPYATFLANVKPTVKNVLGESLIVSCCFSFAAIPSWATYAAITALCDWQTLTYYPVNASTFVVATPSSIGADFSTIATALGGSPFVLQECGCPSSPVLGSSEKIQSTFIDEAFYVFGVYENAGVFKGGIWVWQNDLTQALLTNMGLTGNYREFIASLGLRGVSHNPKPGWAKLVSYLGGVTGDVPLATSPETPPATSARLRR